MDPIIIAAVIVGFYMAWNIGANDVANSMACAVGSKGLTIFWAIVLAGVCNFAGAVLVGSHVTDTVRKGIIETQAFSQDPHMLAHGMLCALLAAATFLNIATYFGMPVSTTHAIVGGIIGFGVLKGGLAYIHWWKFGQIVMSWFISPIAGGLIAFVIFKLISRHILSAKRPAEAARKGVPVVMFFTVGIIILSIVYKGLKNLELHLDGRTAVMYSILGAALAGGLSLFFMRRNHKCIDGTSLEDQLDQVEKAFIFPVVITSCTVAFGQGANDVANAIGPLAAIAEIVKENAIPSEVSVNMYFLVLGGVGIAVGLATFGYRVMRVMGHDVTEITPSRGAAANLAGMATVLACSKMGLPISTTHVLVGAILGVGLARGITAINRKVVGSIFTSWFATVPAAAIMTIVFYLLGKLLFW